jgi:hypothetical protein
MPRVPQPEGFGDVLPTVRQGRAQPVLSPDMAGLPGRQMQEAGRTATAVGTAIGDYALKEQDKVNKARLNDAYNQAERLAQDLRANMKKLQGVDAANGINGLALDDYFDAELKRGISTIAGSLQAPAVRDQFGLLADDMSVRFRGEAVAHMAEQNEIYQARILDDTVVTSMNLIAANPGNTFAEKWNLVRAKDALRTKYDNSGFDKDQIELRLKEDLGKSHAVIIESMVNSGQVMQAKAYFDRNRDDFMAADAATTEKNLEQSVSANQALIDVDALMSEFSIQGDNIPRAKMDARLREIVGDDPVRLKAARDETAVRMALYQEEYNNQYSDNYDKALRLGQTSPARMYGSSAFQLLKPKDQETIRSLVIGKSDERRNEEYARRYYDLAYGDPRVLADMPDGNFRMLRSSVGEANFASLSKLRDEYRKDPKAQKRAEADEQEFSFLLDAIGIDKAQQSKLDPSTKYIFRDQMNTALTIERDRLNRPNGYLSPEEMRNAVFKQWAKAMPSWSTMIEPGSTPAPMSAQAIEPGPSAQAVSIQSPAGIVNIPKAKYDRIVEDLRLLGVIPGTMSSAEYSARVVAVYTGTWNQQ